MKYWLEALNKSLGTLLATAAIASGLLMAQASSAAQAATADNSNEAAFRRVSNRLVCQCSCGYMVLSCNHLDCSSATFIRKTIQTSLAAGKSEDAIVAGFVEQYGPRILPEPPKKGFSLSAWIMPFLVLVLGGALVSYVLWRWKFRFVADEAQAPSDAATENAPAAKAASSALVEKYRAQIDRDLENE